MIELAFCVSLLSRARFICPGSGDGSSEHVPLGASVSQRPPTDNSERFLSMLRFDSRGKVNALGGYVNPEATKTGI